MNDKQWAIWITGQGGQGVSFLAQILCRAALMSQYQAQARHEQQWAIRGGIVCASVFISEQAISPAEINDYTISLCLHPRARNLNAPMAANSLCLDAYELGLFHLGAKVGFQQGLNMALLGYLLSQCEICPVDAVVWQLKYILGREQLAVLPYNLELLEQGLKLGNQHEGHS